MVDQKRKSRIWYLVLAGVVAVLLTILALALGPWGTPLNQTVRATGMLGYLAVFLASLSSLYLRELVQFFGRPFIKVHHVISIAGLVMLLIHPLGVAWEAGSLAVFVPVTSSWLGFLRAGGRPALYLIGLAALAAVLRKSMARSWRAIHYLNYVAFILASTHAGLLGSDFQHPVARAVLILMALVVIGVFIRRRTSTRKTPTKRP